VSVESEFQKFFADSKNYFTFVCVFWYRGYSKYAISSVSIII